MLMTYCIYLTKQAVRLCPFPFLARRYNLREIDRLERRDSEHSKLGK